MYPIDYHLHSDCSGDGTASMADMAAAAVGAGLGEICFTDHLDVVLPGEAPAPFDPAGLAAAHRLAVERWGERVTIRLGLELGEMVADFAEADRLLALAPPVDFVIGSRHLMNRRFGCLRGFTQVDRVAGRWDEVIEDYLTELLAHVKWGHFSVVGHLTLPLRYAVERHGMDVSFAGHMDSVEQVLRAVVERGIGIECNTNRGHMPLPGEEILRMYRRLGGEIITLGSDAHRPGHVGLGIREGMELLRACGFAYVCTYEKMKPIFHKL